MKYPALTEVLAVAASQIQSVAVIHGLQGQHTEAKVELKNLLSSIVNNAEYLWQTHITQNIHVENLPIYLVEIESVPIALVINELVSNAIKHSTHATSIDIALTYDETELEAHVIVTNPGQLADKQSQKAEVIQGAGLKLIAALLPKKGAQFTINKQYN